MKTQLTSDFFNHDTCRTAINLLGKFLVRQVNNRQISALITETEAYDGPDDLASHASKGITKRTKIMFGPPGILYVYLCYGVHYMLNVVTGKVGYPAAVLIRGILTENGLFFRGPGKVAKFFNISKNDNGKITGKNSDIWFEDRGLIFANVKKMPRIGVDYAGPIWSTKKYRFVALSIINKKTGEKYIGSKN